MPDESGTLEIGEFHPAAHYAYRYVKNYINRHPTGTQVGYILEAFASTALSGNRLAEICHETLRRVIYGEPVSDRYLMGLCLTLMEMDETNEADRRRKKRDRRNDAAPDIHDVQVPSDKHNNG